MMSLRLNAAFTLMPTSLAYMSARSASSSISQGKREATTAVASEALSNYANIFTQEGDKVFIHAAIPGTKAPEKRMAFVKLYMYANHLIGNNSISLSDLTKLCNREGYRSVASKGNKTSKVNSGDFHRSLFSKSNARFFDCYKDEENKNYVHLTDKGLEEVRGLANMLNSINMEEEPQGRLRDVLTVFKQEGFSKSNSFIPVKKLLALCSKYGYSPNGGDFRRMISANFAKQLFIFDREKDTVRLSPLGIKVAENIPNSLKSQLPFS